MALKPVTARSGARRSCATAAVKADKSRLARSSSLTRRSMLCSSCSCCVSRVCSASSRSLQLRNTSTTPMLAPLSSRMGATLWSTGISPSLRACTTTCSLKPTPMPYSRPLCSRPCAGSRVDCLKTRKISWKGLPSASDSVQPVMVCAAGLIKVTQPCRSVVMMASPRLDTVALSQRSSLRNFVSVRCRYRATWMAASSSRSWKGLSR